MQQTLHLLNKCLVETTPSLTGTAAGTAGVALRHTICGASVVPSGSSYKYRVRRCVGIYCRRHVSNCSNASYFFRYASYYQPYIGAVQVTSNAYAGGSNVGHVLAGGTAGTFLQGDGTWAGNEEVF